ncbi:hypothetical protein N7491_005860 [Penicillium cf. griseofulvum]|uniref:Uncharacterized protein n=1 Tax=Penicillium cf. griseofulvum TaxID=2972120 RepID=A0A9W9J5E2_9EURO|nr:hypothetical protein N7472_008545 [Penicillium cf. griseofulvum]KAJ5435265.1 hypothetical protein N7491_005860 [Penicillium cf. griseofulvum]KAJ5453099.1 hypothetical protein N7445_001282 [Penicillium cf. griseofulvum]
MELASTRNLIDTESGQASVQRFVLLGGVGIPSNQDQAICRTSYHGSEIPVQRIASEFLMVVSSEPDKGTEDMHPGRKLVSGG